MPALRGAVFETAAPSATQSAVGRSSCTRWLKSEALPMVAEPAHPHRDRCAMMSGYLGPATPVIVPRWASGPTAASGFPPGRSLDRDRHRDPPLDSVQDQLDCTAAESPGSRAMWRIDAPPRKRTTISWIKASFIGFASPGPDHRLLPPPHLASRESRWKVGRGPDDRPPSGTSSHDNPGSSR